MSTNTAEQSTVRQDQQQYVTQQPDMTVVEQLATTTTPTGLISSDSNTTHTVVASLPDQYVQQPDYT